MSDDLDDYQGESRRRHRLEDFREHQRVVREWIAIDEIADLCARSVTGASAAAEEEARSLAYERLDQSARRGEFEALSEGQSQSQIIYLHPRHPTEDERLTREQLRYDVSIRDLAAYCFLPRELACQWFVAHGYPWPAHFDAVSEPRRETKLKKVRGYIAGKYPRGIPGDVTDKEIARNTGTSERTVRRARQSVSRRK
jgi:hypothetical protein